jgi:hypothetical protein
MQSMCVEVDNEDIEPFRKPLSATGSALANFPQNQNEIL